MPLLCPDCGYIADEDEPYCSRCGHDLVRSLQGISAVPARRTEVIVDRFRPNCVCFGEQLRFDPYDESMHSRFQCGKFPGRIDCVACPICSGCGQLECSCGMLGIGINVKLGTTIQTVPVRDRIE